MEHFVTLFNKAYLLNGLALFKSLKENIKDFKLWVVCIDDFTFSYLNSLNDGQLGLINLADVETDELLRVKSKRSLGEYCWTLTPFTFDVVFNLDPSVSRVTYLDSDVYILKSLTPIISEFEDYGKRVLITEHGYAPRYDQTNSSGRFCVQFVTFQREGSEHIREWWKSKVIDWCYNIIEPDRFGDQKYLDQWPLLFGKDVHVYSENKHFQAPWNASIYPPSDAIIFHFHGFKFISKTLMINTEAYIIPRSTLETIFRGYANDIFNLYSGLTCEEQNIIKNSLGRRLRFLIRGLFIPFKKVLSHIFELFGVWFLK